MEQLLWEKKALYDYRESLLNFFEMISEVMHRYYPKYEESILKENKYRYIERLMPQMNFHREYHLFSFITNKELLHGILGGKSLYTIEPKQGEKWQWLKRISLWKRKKAA